MWQNQQIGTRSTKYTANQNHQKGLLTSVICLLVLYLEYLALITKGYFYRLLKVVVLLFVKMLQNILKWGNYSAKKIEKNIYRGEQK